MKVFIIPVVAWVQQRGPYTKAYIAKRCNKLMEPYDLFGVRIKSENVELKLRRPNWSHLFVFKESSYRQETTLSHSLMTASELMQQTFGYLIWQYIY